MLKAERFVCVSSQNLIDQPTRKRSHSYWTCSNTLTRKQDNLGKTRLESFDICLCVPYSTVDTGE